MADVAKDLSDAFSKTINAPVKAVSDTVDKASNFMKGKGFTTTPSDDSAWHAQQVQAATDSFKPKASPAPAKKSAPATKPPKYHSGTDYVPETGPAILKKGEAVLKKEDADKYREAKMADKKKSSVHEATKEALGGSEHSKPKKEVNEIRIKKSANGGHIIKHVHTHPEHHPDEEHTTKTDDELSDHVAQTMGTPNPGEAEADAGTPDAGGAGAGASAGAPPAGAAAPQAGPAPAAPIPGM